ncbi:MAG: TonB-dependent receptor plug domain-containing protein [Myxococcota bacterium]
MLPFVFLPKLFAAPVVDPFTEPDDSELYRLEERIVTVAARYAQAVEEAPAIVTVVTDREIRERGYRTLADLLREVPGVYVTVSNESRKLAWFRGVTSADNNKILLLVDGVPWYDGVYTHAFIDAYLPLDNVRQVEIIKGPGSAIYGTNAFAGVINVVTYTPEDLTGAFVRVTGGTGFSAGVSAVAGQPFEIGDTPAAVGAYARVHDEEGDGLEVTPKGRANVTGTDPELAMNAGVRLDVGRLGLRFDAVEYRHTYFVNEQDDALDVFTQDPGDFWLKYHDQFARAQYRVDVGPDVQIVPRLTWQRHDDPGQYAWFDDPVTECDTAGICDTSWSTTLVETYKVTELFGLSVDFTARPGWAHVVVGGVGGDLNHVARIEDVTYEDRSHDPVTDGTYYAPETWIGSGFAYAQDTWTAMRFLEVTAGARLDYHQYYGAFPSPRLGVLLLPGGGAVVKVLYGRAFRAPTARELLVAVSKDPDTGENNFTAGNPDLAPESIHTVESEASATFGPAKARLAAYFSSVDGQIDKVTGDDPKLGDLYYDNTGGSTIVGAEAEGRVTFAPWEFGGSYSYTHAVDRDTGNLQYEFPEHVAHVRAGWQAADVLRANVSVDVIGPRPREAWTPDSKLEDGPAFALVNLGLATGAIGRVRVDAAITNLLDTKYETLVARDDANRTEDDGSATYTNDIAGEGRMFRAGVEVEF